MRGCVAPNWTMARELMNAMAFKLELMLMDPTAFKPALAKKVLHILNSNAKTLTPVNLLNIDQGASILLTWVINFIKWHSGCSKFQVNKGEEGILRVNEDGSITNED